jgi:hypothetical protein
MIVGRGIPGNCGLACPPSDAGQSQRQQRLGRPNRVTTAGERVLRACVPRGVLTRY